MDQNLLRAYMSSVYEFPSSEGTIRASLDGEVPKSEATLPALFRKTFAVVTAYNPRSMLLPRRINEQRHQVMRELLILGCYRVEQCVGYEDEPEVAWREPAWLVHDIDRQEAIDFGRTFRQNSIIYCRDQKPELIVTDPTCDTLGQSYPGNWRIRQ
jgi:hypothetical protein